MQQQSSPYQVVEDLSFAQPKGSTTNSPLRPKAAPPAAAPPSPPPTPLVQKSDTITANLPPSYHHNRPADSSDAAGDASVSSSSSRKVAPPTIRHDDENNITGSWRARLHMGGGNSLINPNIGLTNSYDAANCPPPHDMVRNIRITTCTWAVLTVAWTIWNLFIRFFLLKWIALTFSIVLACLALALLVAELGIIFSTTRDSSVAAARQVLQSSGSLPWLQSHATTRFLLYTAGGKLTLLLLLGVLCFVTGGFVEFFLGLGYWTQAVVIAVLSRDENFARLYYPTIAPSSSDTDNASNKQPRTWSTLEHRSSRGYEEIGGGDDGEAATPGQETSETASLVQNALQPGGNLTV